MKFPCTSLVAAMLVTTAWSAPVPPAAHSLGQRGLVVESPNNAHAITADTSVLGQELSNLPNPKQPDLSQPPVIHVSRQPPAAHSLGQRGLIDGSLHVNNAQASTDTSVLGQDLPNLPEPKQPPAVHILGQRGLVDGSLHVNNAHASTDASVPGQDLPNLPNPKQPDLSQPPVIHVSRQRDLLDGSRNNLELTASIPDQGLPSLPDPKQPDPAQPPVIHVSRQRDLLDGSRNNLELTASIPDQGLPSLPDPKQPDPAQPPVIHVSRQPEPADQELPDDIPSALALNQDVVLAERGS